MDYAEGRIVRAPPSPLVPGERIPMTTTDATARDTLRHLITGFRASDLIAAAAEFGLADLLANGPSSSDELAERPGAHPDALHRVLRALVQLDVVAMLDDGRFALPPSPHDYEGGRRGSAREPGHRGGLAVAHAK